MKYAVISSDIPPRVGGIETFTLDFMNHFHSEFGFFPSLIITPARSRKTLYPQFSVYEVSNIQLSRRLPLFNFVSLRNFRILRNLRRENEVLVLISHLFILNWIAALLLRGKSKVIWINVGANFVNHSSQIVRFIISRYETLGIRILSKCSTARFSISERANGWIESISKSSFEVIPNPIPRLEEHSQMNIIELEKSLEKFGNEREIDIIFAGRMVEDKRPIEAIERIIDATRTLISEYEDKSYNKLHIEIIGDGRLLENAKKLAAETPLNLFFLGEVPRSQLIEKLQNSKVLIQLPKDEGCPLLTLEAILMGVAVVSTPMDSCINELDGVYIGEIEKISELLVSLISKKVTHEGLTLKNLTHLREHHSWDNLFEALFPAKSRP